MANNLYQFRFTTKLPIGTQVDIFGEHDRYGNVIGIKDKTENGYLHLIRGTGYEDINANIYRNRVSKD